MLVNPMGKLDAGQCNCRTPERLETCHRGAPAFDHPMILLNEIVKVLATPYIDFGGERGTRTLDPGIMSADASAIT